MLQRIPPHYLKRYCFGIAVLTSILPVAFTLAKIAPGWLFHDSLVQWYWAYEHYMSHSLPGWLPSGVSNQWPLILFVVKWINLKLLGNPTTYIFCQGVALGLAIYYFLYSLLKRPLPALLLAN